MTPTEREALRQADMARGRQALDILEALERRQRLDGQLDAQDRAARRKHTLNTLSKKANP